ncbi:hypothetical protein MKX53_18790 [Psychrobacillus sp. FSL K6-4615]|uniref:hypothetical protein n=1 Tax=Psychrobacillus sp. FSL K6-4615 TaxID=2921551 RepID=UPI0030FAE658
MTTQLLLGKEQVLKEVITLAQDWRQKYDQANFYGGSPEEIREFQKTPAAAVIQDAQIKLEDYLSKLSFDDVKMLQTVMYLGRDKDYDSKLTPNEIYDDYLRYIGGNGWNTKEIEIGQMTEKLPLGEYLTNGLKILDITI